MKELIRIDNLLAEVDGIKMLNEFHLSINQGCVQGIYVPKGSVKNILADILSGNHLPLSGDFFYKDQPIAYDHLIRKIYTIGPQLKLVERLSIANNIFVIREGFKEQLLEDKSLDKQADRLFADLNIHLSSDKSISELSRFEQVLVELVKAVGLGRELIVLKDCASFLSDIELEALGKIIQTLSERGYTFAYIDSFIEVLSKLADEIIWIKRGRNKWCFGSDIPNFMLESVHEFESPRESCMSKECVIEFKDLEIVNKERLTLQVYKGDIVNIIDRQGYSLEIIRRAVYGEGKVLEGDILFEGRPLKISSMTQAVSKGIGYINDNPTQTMLIQDLTALDNLCYIVSRKIKGFWMNKRFKESILKCYRDRFKNLNATDYVDQLSIYDRQKLVYYKWHVYKPKVMLIYRPFSSIDRELHQLTYELITELTAIGTAVILLTTNETDMMIDCKRVEIESKKSPLFSKE